MKQRIIKYLEKIDRLLVAEDPGTDWEDILSEHLSQIRFFQHERLAHLIVTVTFAVVMILLMNLLVTAGDSPVLTVVFILLFVVAVMLILYILYYFFLEKSIQKLYEQYDQIQIKKRING